MISTHHILIHAVILFSVSSDTVSLLETFLQHFITHEHHYPHDQHFQNLFMIITKTISLKTTCDNCVYGIMSSSIWVSLYYLNQQVVSAGGWHYVLWPSSRHYWLPDTLRNVSWARPELVPAPQLVSLCWVPELPAHLVVTSHSTGQCLQLRKNNFNQTSVLTPALVTFIWSRINPQTRDYQPWQHWWWTWRWWWGDSGWERLYVMSWVYCPSRHE